MPSQAHNEAHHQGLGQYRHPHPSRSDDAEVSSLPPLSQVSVRGRGESSPTSCPNRRPDLAADGSMPTRASMCSGTDSAILPCPSGPESPPGSSLSSLTMRGRGCDRCEVPAHVAGVHGGGSVAARLNPVDDLGQRSPGPQRALGVMVAVDEAAGTAARLSAQAQTARCHSFARPDHAGGAMTLRSL